MAAAFPISPHVRVAHVVADSEMLKGIVETNINPLLAILTEEQTRCFSKIESFSSIAREKSTSIASTNYPVQPSTHPDEGSRAETPANVSSSERQRKLISNQASLNEWSQRGVDFATHNVKEGQRNIQTQIQELGSNARQQLSMGVFSTSVQHSNPLLAQTASSAQLRVQELNNEFLPEELDEFCIENITLHVNSLNAIRRYQSKKNKIIKM